MMPLTASSWPAFGADCAAVGAWRGMAALMTSVTTMFTHVPGASG